ncbi:MAG: hypothetical protein EA364_09140 [Balneolaceae bacterium]|nr:MAG: hypothetical protein EA364_09140 [Balneolaceae bacterium]
MATFIQQLFILIALGVFVSNTFQGADVLIATFRSTLVFISLLIGSRVCIWVYRIIVQRQINTTAESADQTETNKTPVI